MVIVKTFDIPLFLYEDDKIAFGATELSNESGRSMVKVVIAHTDDINADGTQDWSRKRDYDWMHFSELPDDAQWNIIAH